MVDDAVAAEVVPTVGLDLRPDAVVAVVVVEDARDLLEEEEADEDHHPDVPDLAVEVGVDPGVDLHRYVFWNHINEGLCLYYIHTYCTSNTTCSQYNTCYVISYNFAIQGRFDRGRDYRGGFRDRGPPGPYGGGGGPPPDSRGPRGGKSL